MPNDDSTIDPGHEGTTLTEVINAYEGAGFSASFTVSECPLTVPVKLPLPWGGPESGVPPPFPSLPHAPASRHSAIHRFMCPLPRV